MCQKETTTVRNTVAIYQIIREDCVDKFHLHCDLETIKAASLCQLHFAHEPLHQVLVDNAIAGREERKHVLNKVSFGVLGVRRTDAIAP